MMRTLIPLTLVALVAVVGCRAADESFEQDLSTTDPAATLPVESSTTDPQPAAGAAPPVPAPAAPAATDGTAATPTTTGTAYDDSGFAGEDRTATGT